MRLHVAHTRVTPAGLALLAALPALDFLDARPTARRAALLPLERRFALLAPAPGVLARSNALAAAAVGGGLFPCCCPAAGVAPAPVPASSDFVAGRAPPSSIRWETTGRAADDARGWQLRRGGGGGSCTDRNDPDAAMLRGIVALLRAYR